jgi:hypothetical protein
LFCQTTQLLLGIEYHHRPLWRRYRDWFVAAGVVACGAACGALAAAAGATAFCAAAAFADAGSAAETTLATSNAVVAPAVQSRAYMGKLS